MRVSISRRWEVIYALVALSASLFCASAEPVEWGFPRLGSCHEGMAFADGVTGVLVWGGGDTIYLTVGRADLWDHRGGYPWTVEQSYTNIIAAINSGDRDRLCGIFKKDTAKGEPRNPYMLPLGRVVIKLQGGTKLKRGELDPFTGLGKLILSDGKIIELAMSKKRHAFAMRFPEDVGRVVEQRPSMTSPAVLKALGPLGFKPAKVRADGFDWELPADTPVSVDIVGQSRELVLVTRRGETGTECPTPRANFEDVKSESIARWTAFWEKGARVHVPDPVLQRIFDYGMYRFGAMTEPDGVPAGLQGPWLEDDRLVPWNGDYHFNINVQECYSPAYRGGHLAHLMPLFKMVLSWRPLLRDNAKKFAGIDNGYVLPHSVDDRGVCIGGFWTGTIDHASTAWVAAMMYKYVKYSADVAFLKSAAYDFMKGAMNVYRSMMEEHCGRLSIPLGPSPEWGASDVKEAVGRDPSFQLAAAHRLVRNLIDAAALLGERPDPMWLDVERRLPQYALGEGGVQLFEGRPFSSSHRHHSHMAGFYPFDTINLEDVTAFNAAKDTYKTWVDRGTGAWTGWCVPWASILHTHVGNAEMAVDMLKTWDRYFCNPGHGSRHNPYLPGFSAVWHDGFGQRGEKDDESEIMQMDGQCAAVTAVMELMVHEVNGKVEFFKGCPPEWEEVSFENIRLSDGRSVSGRRLNGVATTNVLEP